jgi:alpha-N-arabinofuranosidase
MDRTSPKAGSDPDSIFAASSNAPALVVVAFLLAFVPLLAAPIQSTAVIQAEPLHDGRISPLLFGNFVELLDDVVPGMWAEMLNDRSFEGVLPAANWSYFDGAPDFCDRTWDTNAGWQYDTVNPFNGVRSAKLTNVHTRELPAPATLTQSGLAVDKDKEYVFSGYFRSDASLGVSVALKTLLPDGSWMTLASGDIHALSPQWQKHSLVLHSRGRTDRAVLELRLAGGRGSVWADKLSLMPSDNLKGWRRDVVEAISDAHPGIIRWGGSTCDPGQYRWKNGIGDRDRRLPFVNNVWGRIDSNDVGVDEFCQFCELTGAQPLICLSFSDGPHSAADLVEYCNGGADTAWGAKRAANGHPAPYHVKYWQIGNEIQGGDAVYLRQFGDFVRLMKQADPGARLMTSFPARQLLQQYGRDVFCVCPHHYTPDLGECDRDFANVSKMIDTTPGCAGVRIAVTEWNVTGGDWGLGRGQMLTLRAALLNARYLHLLMRHSDKAEIACRSNLANSYCGAIIETSPSGLLKRPSYYAMQLYARHAKPVPIKTSAPDSSLDLFACASPDLKAVVVFAVNSTQEPVAWSFSANGFAASLTAVSAEALCDTLDRRQPDIANHWAAPDRVRIMPLAVSSNAVLLPALSAAAIECVAR